MDEEPGVGIYRLHGHRTDLAKPYDGRDYGVYHDGGIGFSTDPEHVQLGDFRFRVNPPAPSAPPRAPDVPIHRSNRIRRETVRRNASIRAASVASAERRQRTAAARMPS